METRLHRIISGAWIAVFIAFAALQVNDPDPLLWIGIYLAAAALPLWNIFRKVPPFISLAAVLLCATWAFLLWPEEFQGLTGKMESRPGVEEARESLGLIIAGLGAVYVLARSFRKA